MQHNPGNPRNETQHKPRQPIAGISGTKHRLVLYEDGLAVESGVISLRVSLDALDAFLAEQLNSSRLDNDSKEQYLGSIQH